MDQNSSSEPTPEQLLKMLEMQIELQRNKRLLSLSGSQQQQRRLLLIAGCILLLGISLWMAFLILYSMKDELPRPDQKQDSTPSSW